MLADTEEDRVWKETSAEDLWVMDKLIVARMMNYTSGPAGMDVPTPGWYCVRPCVNMMGLGLGAAKHWLELETMHLPLGSFWCSWFEGRHLSVDYHNNLQVLCVEGYKNDDTLIKWDVWKRIVHTVARPTILNNILQRHTWVNCEFIGGHLIEVHLRRNEDFDGDIEEYRPVWKGESTIPPPGYTYRPDADIHGRIGAFVR
mgnify:CR=1 FL=1